MTSAASRLARSLGIEVGEGRVFAWGATTLFLIGWGSVSLTNVSETFFLKRVGVDRLPVVFLVNSLLLIGTTYVMSRIAARLANRLLLSATFAMLGGMVVLLWLLVLGHVPGVFVLLVIASKQLDAIALIVFWTVLGGLLHGRQAKRLYAPMIAGGTLGRILGSFASGTIGGALGIPTLLPVAATALGLASLLAARVRAPAPAHVTRLTRRRAAAPVAFAKFGPLWHEHHLFRLLVLSAFLAGTLGPMLYFQFSYIVDLATRGSNGEMRLLDVYAKLRGFINVGVLVMQLVGTSRVFRHIGVPLAATLSPLVYLVGFFGVSTRLDLPSGIGAVGGTNLQDHAIQEPAQKILATLFPEHVRAAATSLIEGPVQRTGGALGNILVLCALALSTPASVGFTALPLAGLWLAIAIALWRIYPTLLLEVAVAGPMHADVTQSLPELVDPGTVRMLASALLDPDPRRCRAACALIIETPHARAVVVLARAIRDATAANRPLLVGTLHELLERHPGAQRSVPEAAQSIEALLTDTAALPPIDRAHLVEAYARLVPALRHGTNGAAVLTHLLNDPAPAVRLAALVPLRRAGLTAHTDKDLDAEIAEAFAAGDAAARHIAMEALRAEMLGMGPAGADDDGHDEHWRARLALMTARLSDPDDRATAAHALADLSVHRSEELLAAADLVLPHAHDRDPQVRAAVLRFVGYAGLEEHIGWVVQRLAADDVKEAAAAAEALRVFGPVAMNALLLTLHQGKRAVRDAALPILHDMPVEAAELDAMIAGEINDIRHLVLRMYGLRAGVVSDIVLQRLRERIADGLHTTLLLLATRLHEDRIAALGRLLARALDGRRRAVLLEALEAVLPPAERARLMPLFENPSSSTLAIAVARAMGRALPSFDEAVRATLADDDELTRSLLAATLDATAPPRGHLAPDDDLEHDDGGNSMLNKVEIVLHLRSLDLFARLTTRELSELAGVVREETYPSGATIVGEGDFGDCMYVLVEGEVRVTREGKFVAGFKPGNFFGEMALFDSETRFATVTATSPVRLLRLEQRDLFQLIDEQPGLAIAMCQTLSARVRDLINRLEGRGGKDEA